MYTNIYAKKGVIILTNRELIAKLQQFSPDYVVVIMTHKGGDDLQDLQIGKIHDEFTSDTTKGMISIECDLDELV